MRTNITKLLFVFSFFLLSVGLMAQLPPPPPPEGHGSTTDSPAPVGSGLAMLIGLSALYGAKKVYIAHKEDE